MAVERRLALAGGALTAAIVLALAGGLTAALRSASPPAVVTIAVPVPPTSAPPAEARAGPGDHGHTEAGLGEIGHGGGHGEAVGVEAVHDDGHGETGHGETGHGEAEHHDGGNGEAEAALEHGGDTHGDGGHGHAADAPGDVVGVLPAAERRLVVVATGIAWNDELARLAGDRLPAAVAFALPADMPGAATRLAQWRGGGRDVVLHFAWTPVAPDEAAGVIPLDAPVEVQAGSMAAQWAEFAGGVDAGVVVEPAAARVLRSATANLAGEAARPLLLGNDTAASPPAAWRLDPALLGEQGFHAALASLHEGPIEADPVVVLLEIYPGLLDLTVDWLEGLDHDPGLELARLEALTAETP